MEPRYTPSDVCTLLGIKPDVLRDRRRRGSHYFGTKDSKGRFSYKASDMIGLAISMIIEKNVSSTFESERIGHWVAPEVAKRIGIMHPSITLKSLSYGVYPESPIRLDQAVKYALFPGKSNPILTDNPGYIADIGRIAVVINIHEMADSLPPHLVERLRQDDGVVLGGEK